MKPLIRIIIPTFNNQQYLNPCVESIMKTGVLNGLGKLSIVNNGKQPIKDQMGHLPNVDILEPGENLGWEGGLKYAIERSDEPFLCFQNDDTFLPIVSNRFYQRLLSAFSDDSVAAVGPMTTVASGMQSIYAHNAPLAVSEVNWLIFFTVMVRRADLEAAGGIDTTLPGGDDFDLSMRFRKMGKKVLVDPASFIIHHGFKTGTRVHGDGYAGVANGWNSPEMIERVQHALIRKHGFSNFCSFYYNQKVREVPFTVAPEDIEGKIIRDYVIGEHVVELGCGGRKTVMEAVGVDRVAQGEEIPNVPEAKSVADVVADVTGELPFDDLSVDTVIARHILEHCVDSVATIKNWNRILCERGRLLIAVPDEKIINGIPLNPEHCHAFTSDSLKSLAEACGFRQVATVETGNGISFVSVFEKMLHMPAVREEALVR